MSELLRLGIIGCGSWGKNYVRSFGTLEEVKLAGLCDLSSKRLESLHRRLPGAVITTDYRKLLDETDAVCIATEAVSHFKIARDALQAGKDVLVEKPLATSVEECERLVEMAAKKGRILMVGHVFLFNRAVSVLKGYMSDGVLGKIYYIHATRTNLGPIRKDVNAVWDLAPHDISTISYLVGAQPLEVQSSETLTKVSTDKVFSGVKLMEVWEGESMVYALSCMERAKAGRILRGLNVHDEAITRNLATYGAFAATERLLVALVRAGADRQAMHETIRQHAMVAWQEVWSGEPNPLVERLATEPQISRYLPADRVRELLAATGHLGDAPERARRMADTIRRAVA